MTIARQLGLEPTTVGNFFMNARRRSHDKWRDGPEEAEDDLGDDQNANIKYEVYDCGDSQLESGGYQEFEQDNGLAGMGEPQYHNMTVVPGPVHNTHSQLQQFPPTCT